LSSIRHVKKGEEEEAGDFPFVSAVPHFLHQWNQSHSSPIALDWHKPVVRLPSNLLVLFFPVLQMMEYQGSSRETLKQIDDMTAEWIQQVSSPTPFFKDKNEDH